MRGLSIYTVWDSHVFSTIVCFCTMVVRIQSTPIFSPDLFHKAQAAFNNTKCPQKAMMHAAMCTMKLGPINFAKGTGHSTLTTDHVEDALVNGCQRGDFLDAVNCIERVMLNCRLDSSQEAFLLRSSIDVQKTRQSILHFCDNIKTYTSNLECIHSSHPDIDECGEKALETFKTQKEATSNMDSLLRFQCPLYSKAVTCQSSVLEKRCGKKLSSLVFTVMAGLEPPVCQTTAYTVSRQSKEDDPDDDPDDTNTAVLMTDRQLSWLTLCIISLLILIV